MSGLPAHASGIIIIIACASEYPPCTRNSSALSKQAVSDWPSYEIGQSLLMSLPNSGDETEACRAAIQLTLPRSVLISPLCATMRYGWASFQDGKVLVEKRWCTSAIAEVRRGSVRSL